MKNYLFAPFRDDNEKIEEFNTLKESISYYIDKDNIDINNVISPLSMFIARLESYYDVMISDLKSKNAVSIADERVIKGLENKLRDIKGDNITYIDDNTKLITENEQLIEGIKALEEQIADLMIDNDKLKADNNKHYPKEYKQEAEEYFNHNPHCKKVLFFMIESDEFEWDEDNDGMNGMNGEYNSTLYADDCIAEIDN